MKATLKQIEKALNNSYQFGRDGSQNLYEHIREEEEQALRNIAGELKHSPECNYSENDKLMIRREIRRLLSYI